MSGVLNSRKFCVLMHRAGQCGLKEAAKYGLHPNASSGHYGRKLDSLLGFKSNNTSLYHIDVPGHSKADLSRTLHSVPVSMPHESLTKAWVEDKTLQVALASSIESKAMPPCDWEHPVVKDAGDEERVWPVSIYCDAVPYAQIDSVLGVWITSEVSDHRFLYAVLRKRNFCRCGCRGWCSFYSVFRALAWSIEALAERKMPHRRHDSRPWGIRDDDRARSAGNELPVRVAVLYVRGDWSEYCSTLGFANWKDALRPCFECVGHGPDLFVVEGCAFENLRWVVNAPRDYFAACERCEIVVDLDENLKRLVLNELRWCKRRDGGRGRTLQNAIPELSLIADDRLEPSDSLPDVALLEDLECPCRVVFWRTSEESVARHRNPLFSERLGITPYKSMTIDTLHCLYLGIMLVWCKICVWVLLQAGVFGGAGTAEESLQVALLVFRSELMNWYSSYESATPEEKLTRVSDINIKMFGKASAPQCKTKGAETWGLLLFLLDMFRKHAAALGARGRRLCLAGQALVAIVRTWQRHGRNLPRDAQARCFDAYMEHLRLMAPENSFVPKHHLFIHLLCKVHSLGNPRMFATWEDEAWNKQLKGSARNLSQATFENSLLTRMQTVLRNGLRAGGRKRKAL